MGACSSVEENKNTVFSEIECRDDSTDLSEIYSQVEAKRRTVQFLSRKQNVIVDDFETVLNGVKYSEYAVDRLEGENQYLTQIIAFLVLDTMGE